MEPTDNFIEISRSLIRQYRNSIHVCMHQLSQEDLWWRPNEQSNSIGNLMLHLSGSLRQWIVSGIGGTPSDRVRQQEFDERSVIPKEQLVAQLNSVVLEVDEVLAGIDPSQLSNRVLMLEKERTWMFIIYHMVEHFSMHTGQILLVTKLRTAKELEIG